MTKPIQIDRDFFDREGYVVVEDILSEEEIVEARSLFEKWLPEDVQPPLVPGEVGVPSNGRKPLLAEYCEPRLSNLAGHPRLVEAVAGLLDTSPRLRSASVPVATYKSTPGTERFDLGYHVDWPNNPPEPGDEALINGVLHVNKVEPGGGAFMLYPGSHHCVEKYLQDPELRARALGQDFNDMPGLPEPMEMCVPAGSAVFFHSFLVHDRSENLLDVPRLVLFVHYEERSDQAPLEENASRFHADHLKAMDNSMKELCGIPV